MPSTRNLAAIQADERSLRDRAARLVDEKRELEIKMDVDGSDDGIRERLASVERGLDKAGRRLAELAEESRDVRRANIGRLAANPNNTESVEAGTDLTNAYTDRHGDRTVTDVAPHRQQALDGCMRTLERHQRTDTMSNRAATAMESVVRSQDPSGTTARYLTAVGSEHYLSAFGKLLKYGSSAPMRMTREEFDAMQAVTQVESERAMVDVTGAQGGFAIPISIDPTILLTSSGALNPVS
jgi:hypothetical protein